MSEISFECGVVVDIARVGEVYQQLSLLLAQDDAISLNAAAIERIDAAALQMFASFIQEVSKRQRSIHWHEPSEALRRAAGLVGMKKALLLDT
ncbi:MAG: STAS domain-containing protein [Gammaproteobacteria bacterium]